MQPGQPSFRQPPPPDRRPWYRKKRWWIPLGTVVVVAALVSLTNRDRPPAPAPSPVLYSSPSTTGTTVPAPTTAPATTVERLTVPKLVGMKLGRAKDVLSDRGLKGTIRYRSTGRYPAGTVISQSRTAGVGVLRDTAITLVVAKAPPPPPPTAPASNCDPSYPDVCLDPTVEDYDCEGGSGNGPRYVDGPIRVRPPDQFGLDSDGDGWGCE
jgi:hypothetical protein